MASTSEIAAQCASFSGIRGISEEALNEIEIRLGITLPHDVRLIAIEFGGGRLNGFEHFIWNSESPGSVATQTLAMREKGLDLRFLVLGRFESQLVTIDLGAIPPMVGMFAVEQMELVFARRFDALDYRLAGPSYPSYTAFLEDLIGEIQYEGIRQSLEQRYPQYLPSRGRQWIERWGPQKIDAICEQIRTGALKGCYPPIVHSAGHQYTDLRGLPVSVREFSRPPEKGLWPPLNRVDFSHAQAVFMNIEATESLFAASRASFIRGRYRNCDFTMVDVENADRQSLNGEFLDCRFVGANLAGCFVEGLFTNCDFTGADLHRAGIMARFRNCIWQEARVTFPEGSRSEG